MAAQVVCHDDAPWLRQPGGWVAHLHTVGGLDISFAPACGPAAPPTTAPPSAADPGPAAAAEAEGAPPAAAQRAVAALAVLSFPALEQLHVEVLELPTLGAPYMPGFLGFRCAQGATQGRRREVGRGAGLRGRSEAKGRGRVRADTAHCCSCWGQRAAGSRQAAQRGKAGPRPPLPALLRAPSHPGLPRSEVPAYLELLRRAAGKGVTPQVRTLQVGFCSRAERERPAGA